MVIHQLQVERRTAKARRLKTDVIPLDHATNLTTAAPSFRSFRPMSIDVKRSPISATAELLLVTITAIACHKTRRPWSHFVQIFCTKRGTAHSCPCMGPFFDPTQSDPPHFSPDPLITRKYLPDQLTTTSKAEF